MTSNFLLCVALVLAGLTANASGWDRPKPIGQLSVAELEQKRSAIVKELDQLAALSLRSGVGTIGFRSADYPSADHTEWIRIDLKETAEIEQIVLVPQIWRDAKAGFQGDGFPLEFQLIVGNGKEARVVASFDETDQLLPRIAPLVVDCPPGTSGSWVKLQVTKLTQRRFDSKFNLELSEILVFSGLSNVAIHQPVTTSSQAFQTIWRNKDALVDGAIPFLMDGAEEERSLAVTTTFRPSDFKPALTIDLGTRQPVDHIQLHSLEQNDTVPQPFVNGAGIPPVLRIEGANKADFSDGVRLLDIESSSVYKTGPIVVRCLPGTAWRFIRLTAVEPYIHLLKEDISRERFGFAEIEILSDGRNVALNRPVSANFHLRNPYRALSSLTDGKNLYGNILNFREWMNQLARRHELEKELPVVVGLLEARYTNQRRLIRWLTWLAVLLIAGLGFTILLGKFLRMRQITRIRERFAADLHDELGANLHAIGILGTHVKDILDSPERLVRTVDEIKSLTDRTSATTRYIANMQTAKEVHEDLATDLRRTARRIIANLECCVVIENADKLNSLKAQTRSDLFLFFKESLININRHADATLVEVHLTTAGKYLDLRISDNGQGHSGDVPASLLRRARLLKGVVSTSASPSGGTCISLRLRMPKSALRKSASASAK